LETGLVHLYAAFYFQIAAFTMLIYDHILTFSDEVERIWTRKITGATILFFLNRYLTPLQFIVITAFHDPEWTKEACDRFVVFEGASTVALVAVCELIMILRVYALYGRSTLVAVSLLCLLAVQLSMTSIGLHTGFALPLPPGITGCLLTGSSRLYSAVWVAPLVTDSCIFILTLWRTRQYIINSRSSPTFDLFIRDGAMYFFTIFGTNLLNALIYFLAPADLKNIGASFSLLMTSVMISRLVLNLRSITQPESTTTISSLNFRIPHFQNPSEENTLLTMTIGNLGGDIRFSRDSDP